MLDVHVWGAGFGLPSIDAECLALVTYLHHSSPSGEWRLIPSNDPSISPFKTLPALHHDGVWTAGYGPIVHYLTTRGLVTDLDARLTASQKADRVAYAAFLSVHAAPLLDLSLFVSAANWAATTRPAYTALLTWPLTWTVPVLIRAEAVKRVEHLGFADMDSDFDPNGGLHLSAGREALPEAFRSHFPSQTKKTVHEEMTPEQQVGIRLYALSDDCFSVLEDLLKGGDGETAVSFFEGSTPSSLDCLAFGYLALMRDAPVPRSFLKKYFTLAAKTSRLGRFIDEMKGGLEKGDTLPWAEPNHNTALRICTRTLDTVICNIPGLGEEHVAEKRRRAEQGITGIDGRTLMLLLRAMVTGVAAGYLVYKYRATMPFGSRTQVWKSHRFRTRLDQLGEAGSMLGNFMRDYQPPIPSKTAGGRIVETDSEVD